MESKIEDLRQVIAIQCTDGTWNFNPYHFGVAIGLLLALSVMTGEEPELLEAPDEWLEDKRDITTGPSIEYETINDKWWEFRGGSPTRPLTDEETINVIQGKPDC